MPPYRDVAFTRTRSRREAPRPPEARLARYRGRLRLFRRFNSVDTKYLANYPGWQRLFEGDDMTAQRWSLWRLWPEVE